MTRTRITPRNASLTYGESLALQLADDTTFVGATTKSFTATIQATGVLLSTNVVSTSGDILIRLYSTSDSGEELKATLPLISAPTSDTISVRVNDVSGNVRIEVQTTDSASLELRVKAAESTLDADSFQDDVTEGVNDSALVVTNPAIQNVVAVDADTEYSISLPADTKRFAIKARGNAQLQIAYEAGESGTDYWTLNPGSYLIEDNINLTGQVLYVRSSKAGETVEVKSWA